MDRDQHFGYMTPCNLRGAGSSKRAQLAPALLPVVIKHCRWTAPATFNKSYRLPVTCSAGPVVSNKPTITDLLRHGLRLTPPIDWSRFNQSPDRWIGHITEVGTVLSFADGVYVVQNSRGRTANFAHSDLMSHIHLVLNLNHGLFSPMVGCWMSVAGWTRHVPHGLRRLAWPVAEWTTVAGGLDVCVLP
jgi:hypothetical protein